MGNKTYDYIIVGAGSAGCVLANRLTESANTSVLLLEFGGKESSIFIQMPTALQIPMNMQKYNWYYKSEPEPHLNGRQMDVPRGKALGDLQAPILLAPAVVRLLRDAQRPAGFEDRLTAGQGNLSLPQLADNLFRRVSLP